jgi:hypothetical protein
MKVLRVSVGVLGVLALVGNSRLAQATITVPDSGGTSQASGTPPLYAIQNSSSASNANAVISGKCLGGGSGVIGASHTGNGVLGTTDNTDGSVAAISAVSGNNTTGLAFYGGGGIFITGTATKPGGGSWASSSDARLKKDVRDYRQGLSDLMRVRPVSFKYNGLGDTTADGHEYVGVIAQELEAVAPSMVTVTPGKLHKTDAVSTDIRHVDPSAFTYMLINAVKEQQKVIERQEKRLTDLEHERTAVQSSVLGHDGVYLALALPFGLLVALRRRKDHLRAAR